MSNIHRIGENSKDDNNDYRYNPDDNTPILQKFSYKGDPKSQSIPSFLKEVICPFFTFKSFSFIIIVINILVFIASLIPHGLNNEQLDKHFLPPDGNTLDLFGNLYGPKLRESPLQTYRWIANSLLHGYFEHVFSNCFGILIFGTMLEYLIGTWRYIAIYILSGILGSLFSVLIQNNVRSVGASISCYGIIGAIFGFDIINWNALNRIYGTNNKCMIIMFPLLMVIFMMPIFVSTQEGSGVKAGGNINIYGHIGGLIFGLFLSLCFIKPKDESDTCFLSYKILFISGIAICGAFAVIGFLCFYLLDYYKL